MATFFFDNDISFRIVDALKQLVNPGEHTLIALKEVFEPSTKDTIWIPAVGQKDWIVISRDFNQRRRDSEHKALKANNVRALYIRHSGNAALLYDDAARIVKNWPKIRDWGVSSKPGTLARLDSNDRIVNL